MTIRSRKILVAALVGAFFCQTWLIYADPAARRTPPLSKQAARGREIWLGHNCQACHQIYGFGGFLGPDLTNATESLTEARIDFILTEGSGAMPAFRLPVEDRRAVAAFLKEVDATGVSQPRVKEWVKPETLLAVLVEKNGPLTPAQAAGRDLAFKQNCIACHLPNHASEHRAPDLTTAVDRLGKAGVLKVLDEGVPGKAMPKFGFEADQQEALFAFLSWLSERGDLLRNAFEVTKGRGALSLLSIPWWEYE